MYIGRYRRVAPTPLLPEMLTSAVVGLVACALSVAGTDAVATTGSPYKISLSSRKIPKGHAAALRRRGMTAFSIPLDDQFDGTDLQ